MPGNERAERAGEYFAEDDRGGDDENGNGVLHEHPGIDEQADGDEEDSAEKIAHRVGEGFDFRDLAGFGDDRADEEGAEGYAVAELHREERNAKAEPDHGHKKHFVTLEFRDVVEQPRDGDEAADQQGAEKRAELEHGAADVLHGHGTVRGVARKQGDHHDGENVLHDEDAENQAGKFLLRLPQFLERLDDDRGGGDGENRAEEDTIHLLPAEEAAQFEADPHHEEDFQRRGDESRGTDGSQFFQAEFEPKRKHQEDHSQLGECLDRLFIRDELVGWRVRPDDHAGEDVAEHDRLLELPKEHRDDRRDDHHDGEVLEKGDVVHGVKGGSNQ